MQKVVRTAPCEEFYWYQEDRLKYLQEYLDEGYTVVMCNSITDGKKTWLEYIVEKND